MIPFIVDVTVGIELIRGLTFNKEGVILGNMKITSKITPCVKPVKTFTIELTEEEAAILRKWAGGVAVDDAVQSVADSLYYSLTYESH